MENRSKSRNSRSERWTKRHSKIVFRVSRGVRLYSSTSILLGHVLTLYAERKEGAELGDEFNIDVDDAMEDRPERGGGSRGRGGKTKVSPIQNTVHSPTNRTFDKKGANPGRCHVQHVITSTLSEVVDVDPKKTPKKVRPISQHGAEVAEVVGEVVEVVGVEVEVEAAVVDEVVVVGDEVVLVEDEEEQELADHVRLNDPGNPGESKMPIDSLDMGVDWLYSILLLSPTLILTLILTIIACIHHITLRYRTSL